MSSNNLAVILNPVSAGGKTGRDRSKFNELLTYYFGKDVRVKQTRAPFEATVLADILNKEGCETIIVIGGDGTIQEVVNGLVQNGNTVKPNCTLGIINSGTGHGFAQSLNLPADVRSQMETIKRGHTIDIDLGKVSFAGPEGNLHTRYFVNELQVGIGGSVVARVRSSRKQLGGLLAFGMTTISTIFSQANHLMGIQIDDNPSIHGEFLGVMIANGQYTGGGMNLAPGASLTDHMLDVLLMHAQNIPQRLKSFSKIYSGKHINSEYFTYLKARQVKITCTADVLMEADGELLGYPPCQIEVVPAILSVFSKTE